MKWPVGITAKKKYMSKTCLIAAFAALLPLTVSAELADWYLSGGMSYINSDSERSSDDLAPSIGVGLMLGEFYGVDLQYNDYSFDLGAAGDANIDGFNLTGRYYFLGHSKTSPYLGLGVGSLKTKGPFGEGSDSHVDVAAGVHWLFGDRWGLRGELRHRFDGDNDALPAGDEFGDLIVSLDLTYALSARGRTAPRRMHRNRLPEPVSESKTTFILLSDEDGAVGRVIVSTDAGEEEISQAGYAVDVASAQATPAKPKPADQAELNRVFGAVQGAFPETPEHYQLYFEFESTELTVDSKQQIPEIMAAIEAHNSVEVGVVGHADTSGNPRYNLTLSERRAEAIVRMLVGMGIRRDLIESRSDGENNPVVPTADNVKEQKNRRVEITIR